MFYRDYGDARVRTRWGGIIFFHTWLYHFLP